MGHLVNPDRSYRLLQQQIDRSVTGAPDSPALAKILRLLFPAADAELAARLPNRLTPVDRLAETLGMAEVALAGRLQSMAERGLVIDLEHDGRRWVALAPVVVGFFEFTFMRTREELPVAELARLFDEYMHEGPFARTVFAGKTQISRSLVREEALPAGDHTEVLDWERASHFVRSATAIGVSLCACRHKAEHLEQACDRPRRSCLSFNYAADSLIRNHMAEAVTADEAMGILDECKQAGLFQTGDNVRRRMAFICNCCGCCCGLVQAIRTFNFRQAIVTSNWIVEIDAARCSACGRCAKACPVGAIRVVESPDGPSAKSNGRRTVVDEGLCLGCGVCHGACKAGAIGMKPRAQRVLTPETVFDRVALMAIERGKLADLIFERPDRFGQRVLSRLVWVVERSPFFKAAMAIRPLRSAFLRRVVDEAKKKTGPISRIFE